MYPICVLPEKEAKKAAETETAIKRIKTRIITLRRENLRGPASRLSQRPRSRSGI